MKKLPTAEEFLSENIDRTHFPFIDESIEDKQGDSNTILKCMIEFAQLHVETALITKIKAMREKYYEDSNYTINELDSFTNDCYPLENIK